jgi:hypothetical protein
VSLQETKKSEFKERTLKNLSIKITKWITIPFVESTGGILVGLNEDKLEVIQSWNFIFSITVLIKQKSLEYIWLFT